MAGSTVGQLMETVETLSGGPWDEGTWGQRVESDVDTELIARHANLVMEITWHWTDTDPIPQVSELAVKETAESIIEVA
ncbi:MAG TPA: hypothetical protein VGF17_29875 [Phytomonospora sp.]